MYRDLTVAVVVPAYNEEQARRTGDRDVSELVDHIVVVDDCSPDDTSDAARAVGDPRLDLVRHEVNQGVGGSILTGHQRALDLGADVMVVMAGDAQMDPEFLPALIDPIADGDAQFTKANRFYAYGSFTGMPKHRVFGNILMSFMTKAASGYWGLFDPLNGYTAVHRAALERLSFDRIAKRYDFENDLLIHLNILRVPARDVPIPAVYGDEISGIRVGRVGFSMMRRLWRGLLAPDLAQVRRAVLLARGADAVLGTRVGRSRARGRCLHHREHARPAGGQRRHRRAVCRPRCSAGCTC